MVVAEEGLSAPRAQWPVLPEQTMNSHPIDDHAEFSAASVGYKQPDFPNTYRTGVPAIPVPGVAELAIAFLKPTSALLRRYRGERTLTL